MEPIITSRLVLEKPRLTDTKILFELFSNYEIVKYSRWKVHKTISDTQFFLKNIFDRIEKKGDYFFNVIEKRNNYSIGIIDVKINGVIAEIEYLLDPKFMGKGFIAEAVTALVKYLFNNKIEVIKAFCNLENTRAKKVFEITGFKLGALHKNYLTFPNIDDKPNDVYEFSLERKSFVRRNKNYGWIKTSFSNEEVREIVKFQEDQIEYFMSEYTYEEFSQYINIKEQDFENIRNITTKGIKKGLENYLKNNDLKCIYWVDPGDYFYDNTIYEAILREFQNNNIVLEYLDVLAESIKQAFVGWLYNVSLENYLKTFKYKSD